MCLRVDHAHAMPTIIGSGAAMVERPKPSTANVEGGRNAKLLKYILALHVLKSRSYTCLYS
jgi:hypothetical protein